MNIFEYLDNLLFGPTLQFEASCRYSLDNAVNALRAVVLPRFSLAGILRTGLQGRVRADHVCVRWKTAWSDNNLRPAFRGSFVSSSGGVRLVGQIGIPAIQKLVLIALPPVLLFAAFSLNARTEPRFVWFAIPVALVIIVVALIISRALHQRDYQLIADALDNALS